MATLVKRGKVWSIKMYDYSGAQKWIKGYSDKAQTRELATKLEDEKTRIKRGDIDPQAEVRRVERAKGAEDHITAYEMHLKAAGRSGNHVSYTIADIRACFEHADIVHATAIQRRHVDAWVMSMKAEAVNDSPRTINRRVGAVQAFLRYLREAGAITDYVLNKYPKQKVIGTERRKRRALTPDEVVRLLAKAPPERKDIYRFALLTGFRYAEITSMMPRSFNLDQKTVTVRANDAKNKAKDQTIPLHADLIPLVKGWIKGKGREERIFTMPRREEAAVLVREDCKLAEVDTTHIDFHALRHTFITRLAEAMIHPKILQTLARHSTLETTLSYYTHFRQDDEHRAIAMLH